MIKDVKVVIDLVKPVGNVGFGCPLILEESVESDKPYTEFSDLTGLVSGGYDAETNVYKTAQLMFMQNHAPKKIAVCSTTMKAEAWVAIQENVSKDWRQLVVLHGGAEGKTDVDKVMAAIEAQKTYPKIYFANLGKDEVAPLSTTGVERTLLCYYTPTGDIPCPVAAIAGEVSGLAIGSYTINNLVIKGIKPLELSESEVDAIHKKGGVTMVLSAGDCVVSEGKAAGGGYIDNTDNNDYIKQQLEYKTQKVFNNNLKIPYTNVGIALLEAAAIEVMTDAMNKTIIESYTVNYLLREDVSDIDRAERRYIGGNIVYSMAGSVHNIEINCECKL